MYLCNYLDVYNNDYITGTEQFMRATATDIEIARCSLEAGDVVITKDSETPDDIGVPAVILESRPNLICGYHLAIIRPNRSRVEPVFLAKQLSHERLLRHFARSANGMTRYGLPLSAVQNAHILLPPLDEQRQVAAIFRRTDEAIRQTEALIAKLKQIKAGLLHDLLTRGLDDNGQLRDPLAHPEQFKESAMGRMPAEWDTETIGALATHVASGLTPFGGSKVYRHDGVLFIRSQNVTFDGLLLADVAHIDVRTHERMRRSEVFAHDVMLNITGASIGRCCPLPDGLGSANVNQHVCAIRLPRVQREDALFLSAVLGSPIGQSQIDRLNAGSNREGLNYQQLRAFFVPWPAQQERVAVAHLLDAHDARIRAEEAYRDKLKQIKKGLMHDLLTGRVRVRTAEGVGP